MQYSTALSLVFSLCLSASYHYVWVLAHSEQRIFMSLLCISLNF